MKKLIAFISAALLLIFALPALAATMSGSMKVKQMVNINASGEAMLAGTLKSISADSLVVSSWGGDWTILMSSTTKLLRRFDGKASLSEFAVGDAVQVKGKVSTTSMWAVNARAVQDNSIQTRNASFSGTISNLNTSTWAFMLTTQKRGVLQVTVNADAKIKIGDSTGSVNDLMNGLMVSVSGVWNTQQSMLMASKVVVKQEDMDKEKEQERNENGEHNE